MGQKIMQHRANMIGARLDIESAPGHGARVRCVLPKRARRRAEESARRGTAHE
jgi:nitrate/nitrite-specific signal transduction histidine kinase